MTAELFEQYQFRSPENVVSDTWAAKTPLDTEKDDFFNQLERLKLFKRATTIIM